MLATRLGTIRTGVPAFVFWATRGRPEFVVELAAACEHEHLAPIAETRDDLARLSVPRISRRVIVRLEQVPVVVAEFLEVCAINVPSRTSPCCQLANIDPAAADRAADVSAARNLWNQVDHSPSLPRRAMGDPQNIRQRVVPNFTTVCELSSGNDADDATVVDTCSRSSPPAI